MRSVPANNSNEVYLFAWVVHANEYFPSHTNISNYSIVIKLLI